MNPVANLLVYLLVGFVGGVLGWKVKMPAGTLIGSMVAVVAFKMLTQKSWPLPAGFGFTVQVLLGVMVGATFHPEMAKLMRVLALPVLASTLVLVATGLVLAVILVKLRLLDMNTAFLCTNPGALSAMVGIAADANLNPMVVMSFHFFRVVFVLLSAPLIFKYFSG